MKTTLRFKFLSLLAALLALEGCATPEPDLVLHTPLGPLVQSGANAAAPGSLLVYTPLEPSKFTENILYNHYSGFTLYDQNGRFFRRLPTTRDSLHPVPVPVVLPAGNYRIRARVAKLGEVSIPVVVRGGLNTIDFLDGIDHPETAAAPARAVRLPDGVIYGWRAQE